MRTRAFARINKAVQKNLQSQKKVPLYRSLNKFLFPEKQVMSKEKLLELIRNVHDSNLLNEMIKSFSSCAYFRDRIAREVMVPRVNLFAIPHTATIREAAKLLEQEGYSRVPVYNDSIDDIVGVLLYKDILLLCMEKEADLDQNVEKITKPVLILRRQKSCHSYYKSFAKNKPYGNCCR